MTPSGRIYIDLAERDINLILGRVRGGIVYTEGVFVIEQALPMNMTAIAFAVPYQKGDELHVTVPFDKIRGTGLGMFAGALAKTFWGTASGELQKLADSALRKHGLPRDTVTVTQATLGHGRKGGLIRISLPRINAWLEQKFQLQGLRLRVVGLMFTPGDLQICLEALG